VGEDFAVPSHLAEFDEVRGGFELGIYVAGLVAEDYGEGLGFMP
jgi:hypothetical protein